MMKRKPVNLKWKCQLCEGDLVKKAQLWECVNCKHHPMTSKDFELSAPNEPYSGMKAKIRYDDEP